MSGAMIQSPKIFRQPVPSKVGFVGVGGVQPGGNGSGTQYPELGVFLVGSQTKLVLVALSLNLVSGGIVKLPWVSQQFWTAEILPVFGIAKSAKARIANDRAKIFLKSLILL